MANAADAVLVSGNALLATILQGPKVTDVQTLFLVNIVVSTTLAACVALVAWGTDRALLRWAVGFALHGITYGLLALRGILPDLLTIVVANTLIAVMMALFTEGLAHFQQRTPNRALIWSPVVLMFVSFLALLDQFAARVVLGSSILSLQSALIILTVFQGFAASVGRGRWIIVVAAMGSMIFCLQRALLTLFGNSPLMDMHSSNMVQTVSFLGAATALMMFAIGLLVMYKERAEHRNHTMALHDPLTQLGNRRLMQERLQTAFQNSALHRKFGGKLLLDLDRFKALNDTHGHVAGDLLLVETARRLRQCVNEDDTVVRLGGDEFVVLLEGLDVFKDKALEKALMVARRIRDALAQPYELVLPAAQGQSIRYQSSCSIGVALFVGQAIDSEELFKRADTAMYRAKHKKTDGIHCHDSAENATPLPLTA